MAITAKEIKADYPLPVYAYKVEIDGKDVAFSEVSGLDISHETTTYKESRTDGNPGLKVFHMPAQGTPANLTLKKGVVRQKSVKLFFEWINSIKLNQVQKKDIVIRLCDEGGKAVVSWLVPNAFPTKLQAPTFDATSNDVAIESMEVLGDGVIIQEA